MALVVYDRVRETTTTAGTGSVTLAGAVTGYQSFAVVGNGNTTYYCIAGQATSEWEVGIGTYSTTGPTLARTTVLASSNAGSLVTFSAGTKDVFVTAPAGKFVTNAGDFASGSWPITASNVSGTVAIANGGSGQTTAQLAMNAFAGAVTSGSYLRGNGTNVVMSTIQAADVPTLNQNTTGTASNVTGTVAIANGGSGQTTAQLAMNAFAGAVTSGSYLRGNGTNVVMSTIQAADVPTLNQNTTGTASNVTGTVAVANGGTGQTTLYGPAGAQGVLLGNGTGAITSDSLLTFGSAGAPNNFRQLVVSAASSGTAAGNVLLSLNATSAVGGGNATLALTPTGTGSTADLNVAANYDMRLRRNSTDYLTLDSSGVTLASGLQLSLANSSGSPYYFNFNSLSNYLRINRSGTTYIEAAAQGAGQAGFLATPNTGGYAVFGSTNAYEVRLQRNATVYQTLDVNGTVFASGKNIGVGGTSPSTSGAGITFPATASISSDANTLDDYEEGSFTPAIIGTTTAGTGTYTFEGQTGGYTKIGRVVHVSLYLGWTAHTGTGDTAISGLPFIPVNSTSYKPRFSAACTGTLAITSGNNLQIYALGGNTTITIQQTNATNTTTTGITPVATTGAISVNLTYYTSS